MLGFLKRHREPKPEKIGTILVCQGVPCQELGAKEVLRRVRAAVREQGIDRQVRVRDHHCLALCGAGPNLKFMPDRVRYWEVSPLVIEQLIRDHFTDRHPGRPVSSTSGEESTVVRAPRSWRRKGARAEA